MPIDKRNINDLKGKESQSRMNKSLDKSRAHLSDIQEEFSALTKTLDNINANLIQLKNVEMLQLTGDVVNAKTAGNQRKESLSASKYAVESNARTEAGLRSIRTVIVDMHNDLVGASVKDRTLRHRIASKEQNEAIKKHRSIGMEQMKLLEGFGIQSVSGLDKNKTYSNSLDGKKYTRKEMLKLWDTIPSKKGGDRDISSMKKALRSPDDPRHEIFNKEVAEAAKVASDRIDATIKRASEMFIAKNGREGIDKLPELVAKWNARANEKLFSKLNKSDEAKASFLRKATGDNHAELMSSNIASSSLSNDTMVKILSVNTAILDLLKGNKLAEKEINRERKLAVVGKSTRFQGKHNAKLLGNGFDLKSAAEEVGPEIAGTLVAGGAIAAGKKILSKKSADKKLRKKAMAAEKQKKLDERKAKKEAQRKKKLEIDKKKEADKQNKLKEKRTANKAKADKTTTKSSSSKSSKLPTDKKINYKSKIDPASFKGKIKSWLKGSKATLAALRVAIASKNLSKIRAILTLGGPVSWLILAASFAVESMAFAYVIDIVDEIDKEGGATGASPMAVEGGVTIDPGASVDRRGRPISTLPLNHKTLAADTLDDAVKMRNAAIQPSIDGGQELLDTASNIVNSGNTVDSGNSVVIHNYGGSDSMMNSTKLYDDPLIYSIPHGPGY